MKKLVIIASLFLLGCSTPSTEEILEAPIESTPLPVEEPIECEDFSEEIIAFEEQIADLEEEVETMTGRVQNCETSLVSISGEEESTVEESSLYSNPYYEIELPEPYFAFESVNCEGYCSYFVRIGRMNESSQTISSISLYIHHLNWFSDSNSLAAYEDWDEFKQDKRDDYDTREYEEWTVDGHEAFYIKTDGLAYGGAALYILDNRNIHEMNKDYYYSISGEGSPEVIEFIKYFSENVNITDTDI